MKEYDVKKKWIFRYIRDGVEDLRIFEDLDEFREWCGISDSLGIKISSILLTRGV